MCLGCFFERQKKVLQLITNRFRKILYESNRKPNKIWVDKDSEFYNRSMKSCLQDSDVALYSTYNEGKFVVDERLVRTLKNKSYKYISSISQNVYIDKLYDIVNEYNNTHHKYSASVKFSTYIDFGIKNNSKDPIFKVDDHVKYQNKETFLPNGYTPNWSAEIFVIKQVKVTVLWAYLMKALMKKKLLERIMKKNCKE